MIQVKLRTTRGTLQSKDGKDIGAEVLIHKKRFLIGRSKECNLCCPSDVIANHHCAILLEDGRAWLENLDIENGTFLNDNNVQKRRLLINGDRLRLGRLEFEIEIDEVVIADEAKSAQAAEAEELGTNISNWLEAQDEEEFQKRRNNPEARRMELARAEEEEEVSMTDVYFELTSDDKTDETRKRKAKPKRPQRYKTSEDAAAAGLRKLFEID